MLFNLASVQYAKVMCIGHDILIFLPVTYLGICFNIILEILLTVPKTLQKLQFCDHCIGEMSQVPHNYVQKIVLGAKASLVKNIKYERL